MKFQDFFRHFEINYIPIFYNFTTALMGGVLTRPSLNFSTSQTFVDVLSIWYPVLLKKLRLSAEAIFAQKKIILLYLQKPRWFRLLLD